ncbi:hypothetical protein K443DRAFT_671112 [Laccaria amethystina LaAM-08-1]|uniref:Uncharacterized protein n=1 Tax=Laccaria amethystina LaAM-08-1 TaxID=1095629 RepID=A0A0C9Y6Z3_9AGAR|nr:hypothetical protein K443DRAFT_671112 [Laccaria amethystina LaAM-08-1]
MAHPKRTRSNVNGGKNQAAAKQALNKKKKTSLKYKNDELRSFLDGQVQSLHSLSSVHGDTKKILEDSSQNMSDSLNNLNDLTATFRNL